MAIDKEVYEASKAEAEAVKQGKAANKRAKKPSAHDANSKASTANTKADISQLVADITNDAIAAADVVADELYSQSFRNRLMVRSEEFAGISFDSLKQVGDTNANRALKGRSQAPKILAGAVSVQEPVTMINIFPNPSDWDEDDDATTD
jgi:hypothetical protein